jgi:7-cyano-7-deazaguanine synthase in queuosine biosynthesis
MAPSFQHRLNVECAQYRNIGFVDEVDKVLVEVTTLKELLSSEHKEFTDCLNQYIEHTNDGIEYCELDDDVKILIRKMLVREKMIETLKEMCQHLILVLKAAWQCPKVSK